MTQAMPTHNPSLALEPPVPESDRQVRVDWPKLATTVGKMLVDASFAGYAGVLKSALDLPAALGATPAAGLSPGGQAWLLVHRALMAALAGTIRANRAQLGAIEDSPELTPTLDRVLGSQPFEIDRRFFEHPADSALFRALEDQFRRWLVLFRLPPEIQDRLCLTLAEELPLALAEEGRSRREDYQRLTEFFADTLGDPAARRAQDWRRYRAGLIEEMRRPLFNLEPTEPGAVSLEDVYVPLRAYWERPLPGEGEGRRGAGGKAEKTTRVVVWLEDHIQQWLTAQDPKDPVRIISGEPGCGKSSFARRFAAGLARGQRRVLYIPLHRFDFQGDVEAALAAFAGSADELGHDPRDGLVNDQPLLVIFDGLDELSKTGAAGSDAAADFVGHLISRLPAINHGHPRVLVLLAGRPVATADSTTTLRGPWQRVQVLRYVLPAGATGDEAGDQWEIGDPALGADQRDVWWQQYGRATGRAIPGLPKDYTTRGPALAEITEQPLLNYLLALLRDQASGGAVIDSTHALYGAMFNYIWQRINRPSHLRSDRLAALSEEDYETILEEIAVAAWHTADRAVTRAALESHFKDNRLENLLTEHFPTVRTGVSAVLNAFFFQPRGGATLGICEFTHKSFREYLTARRLVREVEDLHENLNRGRSSLRVEEALGRWVRLAGPAALDFDLLGFLGDDIAARPADAESWLPTLVTLFNANLCDGMPVAAGGAIASFRDAERHARNAEETLLAVLNACASALDAKRRAGSGETPRTLVTLDWGGPLGAGALIHRLRGQRTWGQSAVALACLGWLDLSEQVLIVQDLGGADLRGADLGRADLRGADLGGANLGGANLGGADLGGANLVMANLGGANLRGADLGGADLGGADLGGADLGGALGRPPFS